MQPTDIFAADLFPFTLTRSVLDIRIGILTIREKWERILGIPIIADGNHINGTTIPINSLPNPEIAVLNEKKSLPVETIEAFKKLQFPWQIFQWNAEEIRNDFELVTKGKPGNPIAPTNKVIAPDQVFIEDGVTMNYATINATEGPVYIGRNAIIMEGALIRGPFALGESALIKMGATIYGGTTVGPYCVAGGEIKNSVLFGYSNKSHEGYLGDSVIGEWCNLGAGTSNSNLKNNAGAIQIWNEPRKSFLPAGNKCGMLMGDYSRAAINTSFNTGTVTGVSANVFGTGLTPHYIPSFSWGYTNYSKYRFEKAIEDIANWKRLKNQSLSDIEIRNLKHIFENA